MKVAVVIIFVGTKTRDLCLLDRGGLSMLEFLKNKSGRMSVLPPKAVPLPPPRDSGSTSIEAALSQRHSTRLYESGSITLGCLGQLLWAAQGVNRHEGRRHRTAASAGALYPLELHAVVKKVAGLESGVYRYQPDTHSLQMTIRGDLTRELATAAYDQMWIDDSAVVLVMAGVYHRTMSKYGARGERYVHMDCGIAGGNVYLQCVSMGCGVCYVGAFDDHSVGALLRMEKNERPLCLMPVGPVK